MKNLILSLVISYLGHLTYAAPSSILEDVAQLRIESRITIPKGSVEVVFINGKVSPGTEMTSVCSQSENMCVLDTMELAKGRERFLDVNTILNLQNVVSMCADGKGLIANVSTLRNQMRLRCKINSSNPTVEDLQAVIAQFMTVQFPAKID